MGELVCVSKPQQRRRGSRRLAGPGIPVCYFWDRSELDEIFETDLPEIEKLARAFTWITDSYVERARQEVELARAMNDRDALVKEQIKASLMQHAQSIFQDCYRRARAREARDE